MEKEKKLTYIAPVCIGVIVEMEQGIAAGSANVNSPSDSGEVKDSWETGGDNNKTVEW